MRWWEGRPRSGLRGGLAARPSPRETHCHLWHLRKTSFAVKVPAVRCLSESTGMTEAPSALLKKGGGGQCSDGTGWPREPERGPAGPPHNGPVSGLGMGPDSPPAVRTAPALCCALRP